MKLLQKIVDSLGYCLKAEQKQAIPLFVEVEDVLVSLSTGHEVTTAYRTKETSRKSSTASLHTLRNNYIPLPQPLLWGGAGLRD